MWFKLIKSILASRIGKTPYKLNFSITSLCNSRCRTCNIWRFSNSKRKNELGLAEIEKIFKNFPGLTWLSISGGEPFIRPDFDKIILSAIRYCPNLCMLSIPSNGLLDALRGHADHH